tara:strand:+ start:2971 stop:3816 length:846 start_codon:yes stop_codon:yes gene_type:complete
MEWVKMGYNKAELVMNMLTVTVEENYKVVPSAKPLPKDNSVSNLDTNLKFIKKGENLWGLRNTSWQLWKQAADYYLLSLATLIDKEKYDKYLIRRTNSLTDQFARYTDMAVGGELRHSRQRIESGTFSEMDIPRPLLEALFGHVITGSRNSAWEGWYHFRQRYGTLAIRWAKDVFSLKGWGSGYGGMRWANIADTLYSYEKGITTQHTFVDTCFGLEHNGGAYFNKWWSTGYLKEVLDANQEGNYCALLTHSSSMVKKLINQIDTSTFKEMCTCHGCKASV